MRAKRFRIAQVPSTRLKPELRVGQRTHRTDVDNVARILRNVRFIIERADFVVESAVQHHQCALLLNDIAVPCAPLTGDATFPVDSDDRAERCRLGVMGTFELHARSA